MSEEKYRVKLDNFEGPLDLLLHLLHVNQMDIYDIPISEITRQYLAYLHEAEELNLEIASEFLVMAATLLSIKAKMLLPKAPKEEDAAVDPRLELAERLLEYKFYKEASQLLKNSAAQAAEYRFREIDIDSLKKDFTVDNPVADIPLDSLWQAFSQVLRHVSEEKPQLVLNREAYDIEAMMLMLQSLLSERGSLEFTALFSAQDSKQKVISVFLAILELYKMGEILINQQETFGSLWLVSARAKEEIS